MKRHSQQISPGNIKRTTESGAHALIKKQMKHVPIQQNTHDRPQVPSPNRGRSPLIRPRVSPMAALAGQVKIRVCSSTIFKSKSHA